MELCKPWNVVGGSGKPQTPSSGGGGSGAWTLISNTAVAAAATVDVIGMVGHTHYCAILRGLRSNFPIGEVLRMRISDDNGSTFQSTGDHEGRNKNQQSGSTTEFDLAYTTDQSFSLVTEGPDGAGEDGIFGKIWFWEPALAPTKEFLMDFSMVYKDENGRVARSEGFGMYPSFTNSLPTAIDAFRLFMTNDFVASGSIDLYGIT